MDALKNGSSWYDIIYPNGESTTQSASDNPADENEWTSVSTKTKDARKQS